MGDIDAGGSAGEHQYDTLAEENEKAKERVAQLEAEKQAISTGLLELIGACETLANHAARILQGFRARGVG